VASALNTVSGAATPILSLTQLIPAGAVTEVLGGVTIPAGVSAVVIELREELDANLTVYYDKIGLFAPD
jgi:hypothetical protein